MEERSEASCSRLSSGNSLRENINMRMERLRQRFHLHRLWSSVLRSLVISILLLLVVFVLTVLVALIFYLVNRQGHTDCDRYRQLKERQLEFQLALKEVLQISKAVVAATPTGGNESIAQERLTARLIRLRQLGGNYRYKGIDYAINQHELRPNFTQAMYYAVTLVTLIGYGDIAGASELHYFCASLCMLVVVPVWYMYHHQLYHLFYYLQVYCHKRWVQPESLSNRTIMVLWAIRIQNASAYRRSRFYLSNLILMIILFPLCLAIFAITESHMSLSDKLWLTVQSIFHIGLGDVPPMSGHWFVIFLMISTCFIIYFQCFSFIIPQYASLRLSRMVQNDYT